MSKTFLLQGYQTRIPEGKVFAGSRKPVAIIIYTILLVVDTKIKKATFILMRAKQRGSPGIYMDSLIGYLSFRKTSLNVPMTIISGTALNNIKPISDSTEV